MHNHQTFIPMVIECECCELPNEFIFTTKHDRVICKSCLPHTGSPEKQQRKLRDHVGLYLSELRLAQEEPRSGRGHTFTRKRSCQVSRQPP